MIRACRRRSTFARSTRVRKKRSDRSFIGGLWICFNGDAQLGTHRRCAEGLWAAVMPAIPWMYGVVSVMDGQPYVV